MTTSTRPATADGFASRFPYHLISLGVLLYGLGPVLARASDTSGVLLSFWRLWFGVAVLGLGLAVHVLSGRSAGTRHGVKLAIIAGSVFSLNQVLFFTAIKRTSVVDASLMSTLSPIVVAIVAIPLFGERPARAFRLWSLLAIAGAVFVVLGNSSGPDGDPLGMLMAVGSTIAFALFFLASKASRDHIAVVGFLMVSMATAAVLVSAFVVAIGGAPRTVEAHDLWIALAMAVIPGTLGHVVMTWPLNYVPANVPPLIRLLGPVISGTLAWIFLGEGITWVHLVGGAIVLGGLAGAVRSKSGQTLVSDARRAGLERRVGGATPAAPAPGATPATPAVSEPVASLRRDPNPAVTGPEG